jgi:hypothetical protein
MGGLSEDEASAFADPAMAKWIQLHNAEKVGRIQTFRNRYPEWWLIFVDHDGNKWDDVSPAKFRAGMSNSEQWNKIIVIHPKDASHYFEIHPVTGIPSAIQLE